MTRKNVAGIPALDPTLPAVELELKGTTYSLCFDFNAIADYEKLSGKSCIDYISFSEVSVSSLRGLFFVSLLKAHPEMTLEAAGALISGENWTGVMSAVMRAWKDAQPEDEVDKQSPNAAV